MPENSLGIELILIAVEFKSILVRFWLSLGLIFSLFWAQFYFIFNSILNLNGTLYFHHNFRVWLQN